MDYRITPEVITFYAGQYGFDGVVQCSVVEILDDEVSLSSSNYVVIFLF